MIITCTNCGSVYELDFVRTISRDKDSVDCQICGRLLHDWDEAKIWSAKLIEKKEEHKK